MPAYEYIITYYSKVNLPVYKGLMYEHLQIQMEEKGKAGNLIGLNIDANFCLSKMDNSIKWVVLKSQSQFTLNLSSSLSIDDAYEMILLSIKALKQFDRAKQFKIDEHLKRIPLYSKQDILQDVNGLYSFFESRRNK